VLRRPLEPKSRFLAARSGADDQGQSRRFDDLGADGVDIVDAQEATDLAHDPFDEPEVAAGDAGDGVGRLYRLDRIEGEAELLPVVLEDLGGIHGIQRPVLVSEPDPAVKLRAAGELTIKSGHADQDHPDVVAVEEVPQVFQPTGFEPVRFVDL
jgi:hypothetical protein